MQFMDSLGQNTGVAFPFSKAVFQPRDWTQVSHIARWFFTNCGTREAQDTGVGSILTCIYILEMRTSL